MAGSAGKALQRNGLKATWRARPGTVNPAPATVKWRKTQKGPGKPKVLFALAAAREIPGREKRHLTIVQDGTNTVIHDTNNNSIVLSGIDASTIDATDFFFE